MATERENFGGRFAVIMALAGSAIGLGNIWRFPYMVGEYGGAAFILIYVLCAFFVSLPIMLTESTIGRRSGRGPVGAFRKLAPGSKWIVFGWLSAFAPLVIISYYSVVGGWSVNFLGRSIAGGFLGLSVQQASSIFGQMTSSIWQPLVAHTVFIGLSALIILGGIRGGIEKFTKITMPILFVLIVLIAVYSMSLPGAKPGIDYLIHPDFSKIGPKTMSFALGQSFFSMSLGVGTVLTYSSYMKKDSSLLETGSWTAIFDTLFAVIAGFAIMPAVFAAGMEPGAGPSLVFETLPYIFSNFSTGSAVIGWIVTVMFFFTILIAALTSEISMIEVCVCLIMEEKGYSRKRATLIILLVTWFAGIFCSVFPRVFNFCDILTSNYLMTLGALMFSLFVGWRMKKEDFKDEFTNSGKLKWSGRLFPFFYVLVKWVAPIFILVIFITGLIN